MRGSSAMLGPSPDGGFVIIGRRSDRREIRCVQRQLPDGLRLPLEAAATRPHRGQRRIADGLGLGDGLGHLADPLFPAPDIVPLLCLVDDDLRVTPLTLLDEQGGQEPALGFGLEIGHQCLRWRQRRAPQDGEEPAEPGMRHVLVFEDGEELGPGLVEVQEEGQQVALGEAGCRPGRRRRRRPPLRGLGIDSATTRPGALKLLGLDPELGRRPRPGAGRPRARARSPPRHWPPSTAAARRGHGRWRGRAGCRGRPRRAPCRGRRTAASARRRAARGARRRPRPAAGCPDRGRPAAPRPGRNTPAFSNPPVRETDQPRSWRSMTSFIISSIRLAAFWPAASASKSAMTSSA